MIDIYMGSGPWHGWTATNAIAKGRQGEGGEGGEKGEGKRRRYRLIDLVDRLPVPQGRHQLIFEGPGEATELLTAK